MLKVSDIYKYNLGIYMWKNESIFAENFRINLNNTRSGDHYVPSSQRLTRAYNQSIMCQAPENWHIIPISVKTSTSLNSFKKNYKSFLISNYQNEDA